MNALHLAAIRVALDFTGWPDDRKRAEATALIQRMARVLSSGTGRTTEQWKVHLRIRMARYWQVIPERGEAEEDDLDKLGMVFLEGVRKLADNAKKERETDSNLESEIGKYFMIRLGQMTEAVQT